MPCCTLFTYLALAFLAYYSFLTTLVKGTVIGPLKQCQLQKWTARLSINKLIMFSLELKEYFFPVRSLKLGCLFVLYFLCLWARLLKENGAKNMVACQTWVKLPLVVTWTLLILWEWWNRWPLTAFLESHVFARVGKALNWCFKITEGSKYFWGKKGLWSLSIKKYGTLAHLEMSLNRICWGNESAAAAATNSRCDYNWPFPFLAGSGRSPHLLMKYSISDTAALCIAGLTRGFLIFRCSIQKPQTPKWTRYTSLAGFT